MFLMSLRESGSSDQRMNLFPTLTGSRLIPSLRKIGFEVICVNRIVAAHLVFILLLLTVFLTGLVHGAEESPKPVEQGKKAPPIPAGDTREWLEQLSDPDQWEIWHKQTSDEIVDKVERVDRFFGDQRLDDDNRRTRLRLGTGLRWHENDGTSLLTDIKARLALPRLKNRFQVVIDDSFESDEPDRLQSISDAANDSEPDTSLRYVIKEDERRRLTSDAGVRFSSPSQLFGRLRGRIVVPYPAWELRLTQTVAWFTDDGLTETSEMRWTRKVWDEWLFRSSSRLTWEENINGMRPAQTLSLFRELSKRRAYRLTVGGVWPEIPHTHEAVYSAGFTYRQLIHSRWLFLEVTPGMEYPQEHGYRFTPYINVQVEVVFGDE